MNTATDILNARPTFASIVCGVDGSEAGFEAARQAAILTDDGALLTYVAVSWAQIADGSRVVMLSPETASSSLQRACEQARELGAMPTSVDEEADDPARRLMELASAQDLLVLGMKGHSRAAGIVLGSAATAALHRSSVPVLVARRPPEGIEFPDRIVLASDGTPMSDDAAQLVTRLAARHGASVAIVGARDGEAPFRRGLAEHATQIQAATGTEPAILDEPGAPHRAVASAARAFGASLVVTGSRGLTGAAAVRSASERIAHAAPCSVLVVRPPS